MNKPTPKTAKKQAKPKEKPLTSAQRIEAFGLDPILEMVADGLYFKDIAKKINVPRTSLQLWLQTNHSDLYARAREARADNLFEEILEISDDGSNDTYIDENGFRKVDHDVIARSRLRADARKWMISKMLPKKYGDKLELSGDSNSPLVVIKDFTGGK